jgi:hypothetical protein
LRSVVGRCQSVGYYILIGFISPIWKTIRFLSSPRENVKTSIIRRLGRICFHALSSFPPVVMATYDSRTALLLPPLNVLLSRHYLPTIAHPSELTASLLIALYESLIHSRIPAIDRKDKSLTTQIRNVKLLLGAMVMAGWDVGLVDPVGVVEREESCLMDLVEVIVEVGREQYGPLVVSTATDSEPLPVMPKRRELTTISEGSDSDSNESVSTLRPLHQRADDVLSRIRLLNPGLRPPSPSNTTISRATQTSPPPEFATPPPRHRRLSKSPRRRSRTTRRKHERLMQTDNDTESGIPSSIPLSYSSDSSPTTIPVSKRKYSTPLHSPRISRHFPPIRSPAHSHSRTRSSSSETRFRVDSPYTAALRRRRQLASESLRKPHRSGRGRHIRVFSVGRDVADSTFAEDSDTSTPRPVRSRHSWISPRRRRKKVINEPESTTDALTDLERRVKALRVWGGIEEERKEWLLNEIKRKNERNFSLDEDGLTSRSHSRSQSRSSVESGYHQVT